MNLLNKAYIEDLIEDGWLIRNKHNTENLYTLNYSQKTQYEGYWNATTLMCRGLIVTDEGENYRIVGRGFLKFFNQQEYNKNDIPYDESYEIFEKLDGSYITVFYYKKWIAASKGSFHSEQAIKANEMLKNKNLNTLDTTKTYIFEIIY